MTLTDLKHKYRLYAEAVAVEEAASNDVYMSVEMRMMSTAANGNGCVVEKDFMEAVVENTAFYNATPVKVDVEALVSGKNLGHCFDKKRKEWLADQIGAITEFSLREEEGETVMYGKARIEKNRADVCEAIEELYEEGKLFFSFEITAADISVDPKTKEVHIGASDNNHLTAMCIVSEPAYEGATAITFVAEMEHDMEKKFDHNELIKWAAELEIGSVHCKLIEYLFGGPLKGQYDWEIRELGANYMLLKNRDTGAYKKALYHVSEEDEVVVDELIDVEFTRVGGETEVEEPVHEEAAQEDEKTEETQEEETEVQEEAAAEETEEVQEEEPAKEEEAAAEETQEEPVQEEEEKQEAEAAEEADEETHDDADDADDAEDTDDELERLRAEVEELRKFKEEAEQEKQAAEKEERVEALRYAAEKLGLDTNEFGEDISSLNYEKIMASLKKEKNDKNTVNGLVDNDGMGLKTSRWAGYISDTTGLGE